MASLRDVVRRNKDELRDGIAWVAFWKEGRSWQAEYFYLECEDDILCPEDKTRLEEIQDIDPSAVVLNGYYCGYLGEEMNVNELAAGVRWHYENGSANDISSFIDEHKGMKAEKNQEITEELPEDIQEDMGKALDDVGELSVVQEAAQELPESIQEGTGKEPDDTGEPPAVAEALGALIIPIPASCAECKYSYGYLLHYCSERIEDLLLANDKIIPIQHMKGKGRPDWCPIRAVPDDLNLCGEKGQALPSPELSYRLGWNICKDAIVYGVPKPPEKKMNPAWQSLRFNQSNC